MKRLNRRSVYLLAAGLSLMSMHSVYAASSLQPQDNNLFKGFAIGGGVGYSHSITNDDTVVTMYSTAAPASEYARDENVSNGISPLADVSYYFRATDRLVWGFDALYKYIGLQQFNQAWTGTFPTGVLQQANLYTKLEHEGILMLTGGYNFNQWLVFGGVGATFITMSTTLQGDTLPSTSTSFTHTEISKDKTLWGVGGQVGFDYMLPAGFDARILYSLSVSMREKLPLIRFNSNLANSYSVFTQRVQVIDQGIGIIIKKYF